MSTSPETPLSERQSFDLIQAMIRQAQGRIADDGSHYLLWGWLVLGTALLHLGLLQTPYASFAGGAWLSMLVGGIRTTQLGHRHRGHTTNTYTDRMLGSIWAAVGAGLGISFCIFFTHPAALKLLYPVVLILYGVGLFTSGSLLNFRPLQVGGSWCWGLAFTIAWLPFQAQLIGLALGAAGGYLVPGYLLRARFRAEQPLTPIPDAARAV